jgi:hypothetical protein
MEAQPVTRRDLETALIEKCWKNPEFRKAVVSDPKGMIERHTGQELPPHLKIFIHEEDSNTLHLTIPLSPTNVTELSDADLEKVAGGTEVVISLVSVMVTTAAITAGSGVLTFAIGDDTVKKGW